MKILASKLLKHRIGDGKNTHFWFDNWLDTGPLIIYGRGIPPQIAIPENATVASVILNEDWTQSLISSQELRNVHQALNDLTITAGGCCCLTGIIDWRVCTFRYLGQDQG